MDLEGVPEHHVYPPVSMGDGLPAFSTSRVWVTIGAHSWTGVDSDAIPFTGDIDTLEIIEQ